MVGLADLNALLEKVPVWKRLVELPRYVNELEQRVRALEEKLGQPLSKEACPSCGEKAFFVTSSAPDPVMGEVGAMRRTYTCRACGFTENRMEVPGA